MMRMTAAVAIPILLAIMVELPLYLLPALDRIRHGIAKRLPRTALAAAMTATAALPYLIYSLPTGVFEAKSLAAIVALAGAVSFWYVALPKGFAADVLFLALMAAPLVTKAFRGIYPSPMERVPMEILGQLMWIRLGILAALVFREVPGTGFGFLPSRRDWAIGVQHFLVFMPAGVVLGLVLGFARFDPRPLESWQLLGLAVATFFGMLWVVALSEEFFFRGLLQQWAAEWLGGKWRGLVIAAVLFGLVHLPFRSFPNWKFSVLAAAAGLFYGHAYMRAGSIRAAMVTHALVNTVWRVFFA